MIVDGVRGQWCAIDTLPVGGQVLGDVAGEGDVGAEAGGEAELAALVGSLRFVGIRVGMRFVGIRVGFRVGIAYEEIYRLYTYSG